MLCVCVITGILVVASLLLFVAWLTTFSNQWVHCSDVFWTLKSSLSLCSSCKCENLSESTDWWEPGALWVRGDYICTLFSPLSSTLPPSHYPLSIVHPSPHLLFSYSSPLLSSPLLSSPLLSSPLLLILQPLPPSSRLRSLARCLVHATIRSRLTDGWTARAEAVRQWAKWNRTGPIHYQDSRLCLIFNLYFPGAGWQRTCCMFDWNCAHFASEVPTYFGLFCALPLHQATCHILGRWSAIRDTFLGGESFFFVTAWHVSAEETDHFKMSLHPMKQDCCCDAASVLSTRLEQKNNPYTAASYHLCQQSNWFLWSVFFLV